MKEQRKGQISCYLSLVQVEVSKTHVKSRE
jgi:hypothetical protein